MTFGSRRFAVGGGVAQILEFNRTQQASSTLRSRVFNPLPSPLPYLQDSRSWILTHIVSFRSDGSRSPDRRATSKPRHCENRGNWHAWHEADRRLGPAHADRPCTTLQATTRLWGLVSGRVTKKPQKPNGSTLVQPWLRRDIELSQDISALLALSAAWFVRLTSISEVRIVMKWNLESKRSSTLISTVWKRKQWFYDAVNTSLLTPNLHQMRSGTAGPRKFSIRGCRQLTPYTFWVQHTSRLLE